MARERKPEERYKWVRQPPPSRRVEIPILRVRAGHETCAVCLSKEVEGLLVHFLGGRTRACLGGPEHCEGCGLGWNPIFKGYLAVFYPSQSQRVYLCELTVKAFESLETSADGVSDYRGRWISVRREKGKVNARVTAVLMACPLYAGQLPEEPDVRGAIAYILEAPSRRQATDPPADRPDHKTKEKHP